jgi:hypothetical protein
MSENIQAVILFVGICGVFLAGTQLGRDFEKFEQAQRRREMRRHPAGKGQ